MHPDLQRRTGHIVTIQVPTVPGMLSSARQFRSPRTETPVSEMSESCSETRIELAQLRPAKGRVEKNLERVRNAIAEASGEVDLLVFPECVLSGYFVEGGVREVARRPEEIASGLGTHGPNAPDVVMGFYEQGRGATYNSVVWFEHGPEGYQVVHCHRKVFLPTYGVFDEARFVAPGSGFRAFNTRLGRVGMLVCEEMLHSIAPTVLVLDGAELLVVVAASPARDFRPQGGKPGNLYLWDLAGRSAAIEHGVHVVIAHLVGSEGGKVFPGGSTVYLPGGEIGPRGPLFEEGSIRVALDRTKVAHERARSPLLSDLRDHIPHLLSSFERVVRESGGGWLAGPVSASAEADPPEVEVAQIETLGGGEVPLSGLPDPHDVSRLEMDLPLLERALVSFLRDEIVSRRGFHDVVVGVSGGVDSAVSLFLAARAFGPEHVHGLLLPYSISSPDSLEDGRAVLEAAGVSGRTIEITGAVDAYIAAEERDLSDLRRGNLAARVRAVILWDQAARLGALPLGTGNKSERLLGYFTWHADDAPPVNPLGDLFKTQVWALARHLGIPERVIEKAPSADLVEGVDDEHELGVGYPVADRILFWLLEGYTTNDLLRAGFDQVAVDRVSAHLEGTHWKRELPTVAMLSASSIGEFYLRPVDY